MKRIKICAGFTEVDKCKERKKKMFFMTETGRKL